MGIELDFDVKPVSEAIGNMIGNISHFKRVGIGTGMSEFQTEDMDRNRPFTMRARAKVTAATKIRPHSLYEMKRSRSAQMRIKRFALPTKSGRRRRRPKSGLQAKISIRPILREELYQVFYERLINMFHEKITWSGRD